jgi:outer membrane usher protein
VVLSLSRDHGQTARFNLVFNTRLTAALGLQISATRSYAGEGVWTHNVYSTLNWSLPGHHSAAVGAQAGSGGLNATARVAKPLIERTDVGYRASGTIGDSTMGSAAVEGRSPIGQVGATYTNVNGDGHTLLEASGSVTYIGRKVSFSRPTTQSFAVIEVPGAAGVRGYLNNREVGRTDSNGRLFIQDLQPYQGNRLRIEQADLPMDYLLDEPEIVLAPPVRGGAVVRFDARPVRLVRGRIVSNSADKSPLSYGALSVEANGVRYSSPLGSDGQFELDGLTSGTWNGVVETERGPCRVLLRVESADELVLDVGTLTCEPESGVAE